jgi:hypothetical protein
MQTITLSTVVFLATIFVTFVASFITLGNMLAQYILG